MNLRNLTALVDLFFLGIQQERGKWVPFIFSIFLIYIQNMCGCGPPLFDPLQIIYLMPRPLFDQWSSFHKSLLTSKPTCPKFTHVTCSWELLVYIIHLYYHGSWPCSKSNCLAQICSLQTADFTLINEMLTLLLRSQDSFINYNKGKNNKIEFNIPRIKIWILQDPVKMRWCQLLNFSL